MSRIKREFLLSIGIYVKKIRLLFEKFVVTHMSEMLNVNLFSLSLKDHLPAHFFNHIKDLYLLQHNVKYPAMLWM